MPITHTDGLPYFSQAELEAAITGRVKAKDTEIAAHLAKIKEIEPRATQAAQLEAKLLEEQGRFGRYQAAAALGVTDTDTLWMLEQAHGRVMAGVPEAQRADFGAWLGAVKADPNIAPAYVRPIFSTAGSAAPAPSAPGQPVGQPAAGQPAAAPAGQPAGPAAGQPTASQGAAGQPAGPAAGQPPGRPAWAPANVGQQQVEAGRGPSYADRVGQARSLEDLVKLQQERRRV